MRTSRINRPGSPGMVSALPPFSPPSIVANRPALRSDRNPTCCWYAATSSRPEMDTCQYQSPRWLVPFARFQVCLSRATMPNRSKA